jgi:protein-tyrosine phosphatase
VNERIDVHSHVLPGLDDGAKDLSESLGILTIAASRGFARIICTPHVISGVYDHDAEEIRAATAHLADAARERGIAVELDPGAENFLDDTFFDLLEEGRPFPMGGTGKSLLVEAPFLRLPAYLEEITFRMMVKQYRPILAHPERYQEFIKKPKRVREVVDAGYRLQVNLGSFAEMYGRDVRKAAEKLVDMGVVEFAGSDAHSVPHAELIYGEGLDRFVKAAGEEEAYRILVENPAALLAPPQGRTA